MEKLTAQLNVSTVETILLAANHFKRKRCGNRPITTEYQQKLNVRAAKILQSWKTDGVPKEIFLKLEKINLTLITKFNLAVQNCHNYESELPNQANERSTQNQTMDNIVIPPHLNISGNSEDIADDDECLVLNLESGT